MGTATRSIEQRQPALSPLGPPPHAASHGFSDSKRLLYIINTIYLYYKLYEILNLYIMVGSRTISGHAALNRTCSLSHSLYKACCNSPIAAPRTVFNTAGARSFVDHRCLISFSFFLNISRQFWLWTFGGMGQVQTNTSNPNQECWTFREVSKRIAFLCFLLCSTQPTYCTSFGYPLLSVSVPVLSG